MTMPSSGQIQMGQINSELGRSFTAQLGLDGAENGSYGTIAPYSPSKPNASNPAAMSEWWGYNGAAFPYYMKAYISAQSNCGTTVRLWQIGTATGGWSYVADCVAPGCNNYALCGAVYSLPGGYTREFAFTAPSGAYIRYGGSLFDPNACGYVDPNSRCGLANPLGIGGISSNWDIGFVAAGCGANFC